MIRFVLYESYFGLYVVVIRQKRKERGVVRPLYCMGQSVDGSKQWSAVIVESTFMVDFDYQGSGKKMLPEKKYQCSGDGLLPPVTNTPKSCYSASYNEPNTESIRLQHARYPHEHMRRSCQAQRQYNPQKSNILTSFGAPFRTPLHVLAVTQEPFLKASTWVYSHKPTVYNTLLGP